MPRRFAPRNDGVAFNSISNSERMYVRILAARFARGLHELLPSRRQRAQGRPGARCTRGLVCKLHKEMRTRAYRFSGNTPAFPAQWFYGLYRALLGDRLSCHHRLAGLDPQNLTPASGRQNHTTSPSASRAVRQRHIRVHRIPPHVRDDREPPLLSGETGEVDSADLPDGVKRNIFRARAGQVLLICPSGELFNASHTTLSVIPGRAKHEPGIHSHDREYGFRARAKWRVPE